MIPEFENENNAISIFRRNLHLALRRRTWSFKRNGRLNEILPQKPVRRSHSLWHSLLPLLAALLLCKV